MNHAQRRQILLAAGAMLVAPIVVRTQRGTKPYRIGVLTADPDEMLRQSMRELGRVALLRNPDNPWRLSHGRPAATVRRVGLLRADEVIQ